MKNIFTFREINDKNELEEFFRFRYGVYCNCEGKFFMKENQNRVDIDSYDVHSRHFALTTENANAGYLRLILPKAELTNTDVLEIGKKYKLLDEEEYFNKNGKAPFPFLSYEGVPQSHWNYFNELQRINEKLSETSRFMIHKNFRSIHTSKFLAECAIVFFSCYYGRKMHSIISIRAEHSSFYEHYGLIPIANREGYVFNNIKNVTLSLPLSESLVTSTIPQTFHTKFKAMGDELCATGKIEMAI